MASVFHQTLRVLVLATALSLTACGGSDGGDSNQATSVSWQFNEYSYSTTSGSSTSRVIVDSNLISLDLETEGDVANGEYSGSRLSVLAADNGPGEYRTVFSTTDLTDALMSNAAAKVVHIESAVGTINGTAQSLYRPAADATVQVTVDSAGAYHFTTPERLIVHRIELLGGIAGAPATAYLSLENVHDF